ncbi:glycosyltransferase family 39 protein [Candidatus Sumerlaeota bacterium]|nr:glycosyltransferase family 39 protein [Candidatus Sumerlaeota bacterium]
MGTNSWPAILLIALGCALRLCALGQEALWSDEYYTLMTAQEPTTKAVLSHVQLSDPHPPLYFLLMHGWMMLAGGGDVALRLPSALAGCVSLPLLWWLATMLFPGRRLASGVALLLFAVSPMQIWYAQEARVYALQATLELGMLSALCAAWRRNGEAGRINRTPVRLLLGASGILAVLAVYAHYHSAFLVLAYMILLAVWASSSRDLRPLLVTVMVAVVVACAPAAYAAAGNLFSGKGIDWMPQNFTVRGIVDVWQAQVIGPLSSPVPQMLFWLALGAGAVLLALGGMTLLWSGWRDGTGRSCVLVIAMGFVCCLVLPVVISLTWKHIIFYGQRYLTIATPFVVLAFGAAFTSARKGIVVAAGVLTAVLLCAQAWYLADYYSYRQKHVWDSAARFVEAHNPQGLPLIVRPARLSGLFERYLQKPATVQGIDDLRDLKVKGSGLILVTLSDTRGWFEAQGVERSAMTSALFETHRKGQDLWVLEVRRKAPTAGTVPPGGT